MRHTDDDEPAIAEGCLGSRGHQDHLEPGRFVMKLPSCILAMCGACRTVVVMPLTSVADPLNRLP